MKNRVIISFVALLTACGGGSGDPSTSNIYAQLFIRAEGSGQSRVMAIMRLGGAESDSFLELQDGDHLIAWQEGEFAEMQRREWRGMVSYDAYFTGDMANTGFKIEFKRTIDGGAPSSSVSLPFEYSVLTPTPGTTFSRSGETIMVTWAPSGSRDYVLVTIEGECIEPYSSGLAPDTGRFSITPNSIQLLEDASWDICTATMEVALTRVGTRDPAYGGGYFYGQQVRTVAINSGP